MGALSEYKKEYGKIVRLSSWCEVAAVALSIPCGAVYLVLELGVSKSADDWLFVSILIAATVLLLLGERIAHEEFFRNGLVILSGASGEREASQRVLALHRSISKRMYEPRARILAGLAYGLLLSFSPFILGVWEKNASPQYSLASFLFFVNFVTGNALYTLTRFLFEAKRLSRSIRVTLWNTRTRGAEYYMRSVVTVAACASIYVSLSMTSILFSPFRTESLVAAYVAFCILIISISLAFLYAPVTSAIIRSKRRIADQIGQRLQLITEELIANPRGPEGEALFEEMQRLLRLKSTIGGVSAMPFSKLGVSAVALMMSVLSHPLIVQGLLKLTKEPAVAERSTSEPPAKLPTVRPPAPAR